MGFSRNASSQARNSMVMMSANWTSRVHRIPARYSAAMNTSSTTNARHQGLFSTALLAILGIHPIVAQAEVRDNMSAPCLQSAGVLNYSHSGPRWDVMAGARINVALLGLGTITSHLGPEWEYFS